MAVIQKIRDKYAKLAGFIIALALVGFILMDAASGRFGDLLGRDSSVVKVNGEKVDQKEYSRRVSEYETLYELSGNKITDATRAQIHSEVLKQIIFEMSVKDQMDDLGLTITKEEEKDLISGPNPSPMVRQFPYFMNQQTGQFDPQLLNAFETNKLDQSNPQVQKAMEQWQTTKDYLTRSSLYQKYITMFNAVAYVPKFITDRQAKDLALVAHIKYVKVPYTTVDDKSVPVTDDDISDYIKRHAAQYKVEDPSRSIEYVSFDVKPSHDDTAKAYTALTQLADEFSKTTDPESFVNRNSEESYTGNYVNKKTFMSAFADSILDKPAGYVYGPYFEGGSYKLTKVLERTSLPDSVKARHILIKTKDRGQEVAADSVAKKRIDSAVAAINSGADFKQVVEKYTEDEGSKAKGGEYEFTLSQRSGISKEFGDFIFEGKTGEKKLVKVDNDNYSGYHYIEILSQGAVQPAVKLATISKPLFPSDETENAAYAAATAFAGKNSNEKAFDEAVKKENLNKLVAENVKVNDFSLPGLGASRDIIRWMYQAKVGDVSQVINLDGRYVVAKLSSIQDKGLVAVTAANRPMFESLVKAEKKSKIIIEKYKSSGSVEAIAQAAAQPVQTVDSFNAASTYLPNIGYEPKLVGYTFYPGFKPNTVSPGIKGQDGVFFTTLISLQQNPAGADPRMLDQQTNMMTMQLRGGIPQALQETVRKHASVKYNADNLY